MVKARQKTQMARRNGKGTANDKGHGEQQNENGRQKAMVTANGKVTAKHKWHGEMVKARRNTNGTAKWKWHGK